ncbi:MAG TPA: hypothetical protein VGP26_10150 [Actinophytocola sp.]|nr:hypothetical protein [Actinophytocola sp.]
MLWLAAAALAVWSTFASYFRLTQRFADSRVFEYAPSGWSWNLHADPSIKTTFGEPVRYGIALVIAAALLVATAIIALGRRSPRVVGTLATGLLLGAAIEVLTVALANYADDHEVTRSTASGTWILLGGCLAAAVALVLALLPAGAGPRVEPATPRLGVPVQYTQPHLPPPGQEPPPAPRHQDGPAPGSASGPGAPGTPTDSEHSPDRGDA